MKFAIALLATLVLCDSAVVERRPVSAKKSQIEEQWATQFPEITKPNIRERVFKDGNEYRYLYDGQMLTGLTESVAQYSGARMRALVKIQLGQKDMMQIEKVYVASLHERYVSDPQTLLPLDVFEAIPEEDAPFEEVLKKPVSFTYENGKIKDFTATSEDPSWSINIKRAILATFHLSLTDREYPEGERPNPSRNEMNKPATEEKEEYYTVVEDGAGGRCEASYLVLEVPESPEYEYPIHDTESYKSGKPTVPELKYDGKVLNVTKTWNHRNCEYRPFVFKGIHLQKPCPHCENDPESFFDFLESAAHTNYNLIGDKREYVIESAVTEAIYKVTPGSHYAGSMIAYTNATLVLLSSGPVSRAIQFVDQNAVQIDGLHMINPRFSKKEGNKFLYETPEADKPIVQNPAYWPTVANKPEKIRAMYEKLVKAMQDKELSSDYSVLIEEIQRLLKFADAEELQQIYDRIKTVNVQGVEKEEIEHVFADLLMSGGTRCTFAFLKKLITESTLKGPVVRDIFGLMPLKMDVRHVDQRMIESMFEICTNENVQQDTFAKRACWLAYGTLIHKACGHNNFDARVAWKAVESKYTGQSRVPREVSEAEHEPENLRCPVEFRQRITKELGDKLKAADEEQQITIIKTLGNMGLKETLDELEDIAEDDNVPVYIRTQSIYAMRHIAPDYPEDVAEVLLPIYRETNNPTQVRIAAFVIVLAGFPELPIIQDVAQSLNYEPDVDVASYVYSSLTTLANSTDPCLKNVTRDVQLALEFVKPVNEGWRHSHGIHHGTFSPITKSGLYWEFNRIMDKDAPFVRAANFRLSGDIMKKSFDIFEVTFETEGFGDSLRRVIGNYNAESLADVLSGKAARRYPRETEVSAPNDISEINQALNIEPKEPKELHGTASIKIMGQETRFVVINPQTITKFMVELISQSSDVMPKLFGEGLPIDNRRAMLLMNTRVEFPTVLGVPIFTSFRLPIFGGIKGNVKVGMEPRPEAGLGMLKSVPKKLTIESDIETKIAGELHTKLAAYFGFFKIGTGIRTRFNINVPFDGKVDFDMQTRMSKVTMDLPEDPIKLLKIQHYPVTYVTKFSKNEKTFEPFKSKSTEEHPEIRQRDVESDEETEPTFSRRPTGEDERRYLRLKVYPVDTELVTDDGHVSFKKFAGLPAFLPELWEVSTPDFYKSRQMNFTIGHPSMELRFGGICEYPSTVLPGKFLPTLASKGEFELVAIPKKGVKSISVTVFERSHMTVLTERELLPKLQDKLPGMTIKDLSRSNVPKDYERFPKLGHSLQILVNSDGTESPEAWTTRALLAIVYSVDGRYVKTIANMESKVPALAKKVCFAGELRYPDRNGMWFLSPELTASNKSVQGNMEASWGDECGADKMIKLRMRIQKTDEQKEIEKRALYDINGIPVPKEIADEVTEADDVYEPLYKECQEDRQRGAFFSKPCYELAVKYTALHKLKIDVEYKNVPRSIKKILHKTEALAKAAFMWNTDVDDIDVDNADNKLNAIVEMSADRKLMDIKYMTPTQNVNMTSLELPFDIHPVSALFPWSPARLVGLDEFPSCTLTGPKISTFDDVDDELTLSGSCWHVMAKDNGPQDLFAVLVANVQANSPAKKIAVLFKGGHRIEIVPKSANFPTSDPSQPIGLKNFVVKYNGQELSEALTPAKRTTIPPATPREKQELADIMLVPAESCGNNEPVVGIFSHPTGLMVLFDGSSVTVLPSPWWKGGVIGVCGPYNGQPWDDFLLPNKTYVERQEDYSRAFMIERSGCDATIPELKDVRKRPTTRYA